MTVIHCRKYWIDFKGGILLSRILSWCQSRLRHDRSSSYRFHWLPHDDIPTNWIGCWMLLRQNLPKQQLCRKHERLKTHEKTKTWHSLLTWAGRYKYRECHFFVKQVHRCLASRDSSTCVVILKPTSATRHQRHVQSWAVCRFVLFVSSDTWWLLAASMFCTIVKIHKPVVCCKKMPPRENSINCGFGGIYKTNPWI